jgi:hypothetical protein
MVKKAKKRILRIICDQDLLHARPNMHSLHISVFKIILQFSSLVHFRNHKSWSNSFYFFNNSVGSPSGSQKTRMDKRTGEAKMWDLYSDKWVFKERRNNRSLGEHARTITTEECHVEEHARTESKHRLRLVLQGIFPPYSCEWQLLV